MDTMLLVVTVVSLVVAAASATVAWQVTRAERQRRAARVAVLATAAGVPAVSALPSTPFAAASQAPAPASAIDVTADLHEFTPMRDELPAPAPARVTPTEVAETPVAVGALFAGPSAASGSAGRQQWLMGAAGVFAAVVVTFAGIGFLGSRAAGTVAAPQRIPLELVALSHNRAEGGLAVAGLVRNPVAAAHVQQVEAEVRVFDAAGILIGSRTTRVEAPSLEPGQEASFAVALGEMATAARYRVSFSAAGTMLPHVDRRTNQPAAVTAEAR